MAIPEPEFEITAYQLENIIKELGHDWKHIANNRIEFIHKLRSMCFDHLDTISII